MTCSRGMRGVGVLCFVIFLGVVCPALADTHYVSVSNTTPASPYTNWTTAATNIQDAVDQAAGGDVVLVTNGVYDTGVAASDVPYNPPGVLTSRLAIAKGVTVSSVNGPASTFIVGQGPTGPTAVRCVSVSGGGHISGFTLTQGHTANQLTAKRGGGVFCMDGTVSDCVITGNFGVEGAGVYLRNSGGLISGCTISGNQSYFHGGGIYASDVGTISKCVIYGNSAVHDGGGVYANNGSTVDGWIVDSIIAANRAESGGGVMLLGDVTIMRNCLVYGNSASIACGGVRVGYWGNKIENCTIVDNSGAGLLATSQVAVQNTIIYHNGNDWGQSDPGDVEFFYCCTTPDPGGPGIVTNDPVFVDRIGRDYRLSGSSPCIDVGTNLGWMAAASDLDGNGRILNSIPDIGAYEFVWDFTCGFTSDVSYGFAPLQARFVPWVTGTNTTGLYYRWDCDDDGTVDYEGLALEDLAYTYQEPGLYSASLSVSNSAGEIFHCVKQDYVRVRESGKNYTVYVSKNGSHQSPYTNWATAATSIQPAVDVTVDGDTVLVADGTYSLSSEILVDRGIKVASVNGSELTVIDGDNITRCFRLTHCGCTISGFTLTRGWAFGNAVGGAVYCDDERPLVQYCTIISNTATAGGGGTFRGTIRNCVIRGNQAFWGGGAAYGTLENCVVLDNAAVYYYTFGAKGGGVAYCSLFNSIVTFNTADETAPNTWLGRKFSSLTGGDPLFVDAANGDYRLQTNSPCIDAGQNQPWMIGAVDFDGVSRVLNGIVDIGAYELAYEVNLRGFLQGAYTTDAMRVSLCEADAVPLMSPYAEDVRSVSQIPSNVTDWVLVELRQTTNGISSFSRSALVRSDGWIADDDGSPGIRIGLASGEYYVTLKHRNHLSAMSATPVSFISRIVSNDFTTGSDKYFGGSNGAVELEPGIWGMIAGDADGDGEILVIDTTISQTQLGMRGYRRGDFDMDGVVSVADCVTLWSANQGRISAVPNPAVGLSPALGVTPSRKTILPGDSITFSAQGSTGTVTWGFVKNLSGASFSPATRIYQAGITPSCIDILEAWDADNLLGRAYVNVIDPADVALAGKAIIIAGRRSEDDPVWPATDYMADQAYNTLLYRGFSKVNIQYLSPETQQDVDANGAIDDVDLESLLGNAQTTFQTWAANSDKLFVYLVDHGGDSSGNAYFRLNSTEVITAAQLDSWLDDLQNVYGTEIIVVIDCCYSGSFVDELAYVGPPKRILITGCGSDEATYFVAGGLVSFSDAFLSGILLGLDVAASYAQARDAMATYQNAWLDDNGDGIYEDGVDGQYASGVYIGATFVAGKDIPQIGMVCGNQLLSGSSAATLWADDIASAYPISRAWCLIIPPAHDPDPDDPVADIVELDLLHNEITGRYEANYDGFSDEGAYKVMYYAKDTWGSVSMPRQSYVVQVGFDERVILVAGGDTNDAGWAILNNMANMAHHTFRQRWFDNDSIYYLNANMNQGLDGNGTNDADGLPTLAAFQYAMTDWLVSTNWGGLVDKLTVCLIGESTNGGFRMNGTETLTASALSLLLDEFQASNDAPVYVVMEFPGSGSFLEELTPPYGMERICIASTAAGGDSCWGSEGLASFLSCFMSGIFRGQTIGESFFSARTFIRLITRNKQKAQLDDNGDGFFDPKEDGALAWQRYIGTAFMTGADVPEIGSVTPDALAMDSSGTTLWAAEVTDMDGISNVWCVITPPDYSASGDLVETNLAWHAGNQRYEGIYTNLSPLDQYVFTFYARDNLGEISVPVQSLRMGCGRVEGVVRNMFTGERIEGADIEFNGTNGLVEGQTYDGYPNNSTQKVYWLSLADGAFPTNVWLPAVDWDLTVSRTGYSSLFMDMCVTGLNAGGIADLGSVYVRPVDTNANNIADDWEAANFPGETVDPAEDSDGDGHNNRCEYVSGTDPTNNVSVFKIDDLDSGNDMTLSWLTSPGRTYQVESTNALPWSILTGWPVVAGPFEATNGQALMQWIDDTVVGEGEFRFYRVKVVVP